MDTNKLFLENTFLCAILVNVIIISEDQFGFYFLTDKTIFYPQGGGQTNDFGWISDGELEVKILKARYGENGIVKHYTESLLTLGLLNKQVAMHIDYRTRELNSAYHTAGHWLSQLVNENLQLGLFPVKGHHFAGEAYIEFDGNENLINENTIDNIKLAMRIDLQTNPKILSEIVTSDSPLMKKALLPKNFTPLLDRPLRLVTIEGYKPVPCGGTHFNQLRDIKSINPIKFYKKGKRIRLSYECSIYYGAYS